MIPEHILPDVQVLWDFLRIDDPLEPVDVAIGLGSHDQSVATYTAELYHRKLFPLVVFTGANAPTTKARFPRGEAVHYREIALEAGVPDDAILVESQAKNSAENFEFTQQVLAEHGHSVRRALIVCKPYHQRRAYATAKKMWPDVDFRCSADQRPLADYVAMIGNSDLVINMLVGYVQRLDVYARTGFQIPQEIPDRVWCSFDRLAAEGFTKQLVS